jgi:hypothetical protein
MLGGAQPSARHRAYKGQQPCLPEALHEQMGVMNTSTVSAWGPPSEWPLACPPSPEGNLVRCVVLEADFPRHGTCRWWTDVAVIVPRILDILWWNAAYDGIRD